MNGRVQDWLGAAGVGGGSRARRERLARVDARLRAQRREARVAAPEALRSRVMSEVWETRREAARARWWNVALVPAIGGAGALAVVAAALLLAPPRGSETPAEPGASDSVLVYAPGGAVFESLMEAGRRLRGPTPVTAAEAAYLDEGERIIEDAKRVAVALRDSVSPVRAALGAGGTH